MSTGNLTGNDLACHSPGRHTISPGSRPMRTLPPTNFKAMLMCGRIPGRNISIPLLTAQIQFRALIEPALIHFRVLAPRTDVTKWSYVGEETAPCSGGFAK
jgi:hypothetical protein